MSSSPGDRYDEYQRRLRVFAEQAVEPPEILAAAKFEEWLHPRARDGKFVKKGGFVRILAKGLENLVGKIKQVDQPTDGREASVTVETPKGEMKVPVSLVTTRLAPKAELKPQPSLFDRGDTENPWDWNPKGKPPWSGGGKSWKPSKPPLTLEERIAKELAKVNEQAEKLSDTDVQERIQGLNKIMGAVRGTPMATDVMYKRDGKWTPERVEQHERLWEAFQQRMQDSGVKPDVWEAIILGGRPGSGKSTALKPGEVAGMYGVVGWDTVEPMPEGVTHIILNPDSVKEMMIEAGMLPPGVSDKIKPMEQVSFIHAESNYLTAMFFDRLADEGWPLGYDTTMANVPHMLKGMQPMIDNDYDFLGLFIDISAEESRVSAMQRYLRDWQKPEGGRFVPAAASGAWQPSSTFDQLKPYFNLGWMHVDNTGVSKQQARGRIVAEGVGGKPDWYLDLDDPDIEDEDEYGVLAAITAAFSERVLRAKAQASIAPEGVMA